MSTTYPTIPTNSNENFFPYDYGQDVNQKLVNLGWTADQYDTFLDWLHQNKDIDALVATLLRYAPTEWIISEADAIGVFEDDDND